MTELIKRVKVVQTMTKDDEVRLMEEFYAALPADSYLKQILKGMADYCAEQIINDWTISPLENEQALKGKIEALQKELDSANAAVDFAKTTLTTARAEADKWRQEHGNLQGVFEALKEESRDERHKAEQAQAEVMRLKAQLYDYMIREKGEATA